MNKSTATLLLVVVALGSLIAATPTLTHLLHALPPVILVAGIVVAVLRIVWFYTRS